MLRKQNYLIKKEKKKPKEKPNRTVGFRYMALRGSGSSFKRISAYNQAWVGSQISCIEKLFSKEKGNQTIFLPQKLSHITPAYQQPRASKGEGLVSAFDSKTLEISNLFHTFFPYLILKNSIFKCFKWWDPFPWLFAP